ncbi:MAG: hypothetical protein KKG12_10120 [Gammaproteobacteria bacterium]|uniref:hypothetical protein n=1 Tax=Acidovorax sp. JG5 TaxID=2822718 RepID=UPI001B3435B6|nr:hypothetical protein [Acidovorax sp. JG5]MBP3980293.1 hypothetical protein [Acidovorax sp. JG5]MBU4424103.1 hypothetical protein [Gammaproteobacteria bacterium]
MLLVKTQAGQEALKDRQRGLTSRQRTAFILFDGKRSTAEVLAATAAMGITQDDVQAMLVRGLLAPAAGQTAARLSTGGGDGLSSLELSEEISGRSDVERYQSAYLIATELTSGLGLRGFRLNLALEGAGSFDDLAALAPKIRDAVGDAKFARLEKALFS